MSAYRICEECGATLDPGERCDCQPAVPLKLIQPGSTPGGTYPKHRRLLNANFSGSMGCIITFAEESKGRR